MRQKNIALVGAGEIGSRHLQSLVTLKDTVVHVVEPNVAAIQTAKMRVQQVENTSPSTSVHYHESVEKLSGHFDVVIIATSARARFSITSTVLESLSIDYLILEKVVFQQLDHFDVILDLMSAKFVKGFVNCPRREYSFYQELKGQLQNEPIISLDVKGSNWGLACNGIHFIDLAAYLLNDQITSAKLVSLDYIADAKRPGYKEVFGALNVDFSGGGTVSLECQHTDDQKIHFTVDIRTANKSFSIDEIHGRVTHNSKGTTTQADVRFPYQSELTAGIVTDLLHSGNCSLVSFGESALHHAAFLKSLSGCFGEHCDIGYCPIT